MFAKAILGCLLVVVSSTGLVDPPLVAPESESMLSPVSQVSSPEISKEEIKKRVEDTYRNLNGYLCFNFVARELTKDGAGRVQSKDLMDAPMTIMGRNAFRSEVFQDGKRVVAFSLSPDDGILQEWAPGRFAEGKSPLPQGTDFPKFASDMNCVVASCYHTYVGVPEFKNLESVSFEGGQGRYQDLDQVFQFLRIIDRGKRVESEEVLALGWGHDCYIIRDQMTPDRSNTIYINKKSFLVERLDPQRPTGLTVQLFNDLRVIAKLPDGFSWKLNVESFERDHKEPEALIAKAEEEKSGH